MKQGKILKIRMGYNPNHSAYIGLFLAFFVAPILAVVNLIAGYITAIFLYRKLKNRKGEKMKNKDISYGNQKIYK